MLLQHARGISNRLAIIVMAVALGACTQPTQVPQPSPTHAPLATTVPTTAVPATTVPAPYSPGEGWLMALESDINADGVTDSIFYRPALIEHEGRSFTNPRLDAVAVVAEAVMIAQPTTNGPWILLTVDLSGANADVPLFTYDGINQRQPAAYLLALDPAQGPTVNLLPIGASGTGYGGPYGIDWSKANGGMRVVSAPSN